MSDCPDIDLLERFTVDGLDGDASSAIALHVAACRLCGDRLDQVRSNLSVVGDVERALSSQTDPPSSAAPPSTFAPLADEAPDHRMIDGFRLLREIGRGGMGIVYEAEQLCPRRLVALKVLSPRSASNDSIRRFRHESQVLARLRHPGIAQVLAAGTVDGPFGPQPYFALELIRGRSLRCYADESEQNDQERLALLAQVCDAVEHAHQKGVIHRDLKPGNILIDESAGDPQPQPKVLDFGVARLTDADLKVTTLHTQVGQIVGTLPYMSPEQLTGDSHAVDTRSDVYSLGVVAYELLTGRLPIDVRPHNMAEAVRRLTEQDAAPLRQAGDGRSGDIETIVFHALEKDPARRYPSAAAFAADIRRFLARQPILARPPSTLYQISMFARRRRGLVAFSIASVVGLVAFTVYSMRQAAHARSAQGLAEAREADARREAQKFAAVNDFLQDMLASASPEQSHPARDLTVRAALESAVASLDSGALSYQPEIEVPVRTTIGNTFRALGDFAQAHAHLQRAADLAEAAWPDGHPDRAMAIHKLARLLEQQGNLDRAEILNRQALAMRRALLGEDHPDVATSMNNLGWVLVTRGKLAEAEALLRETLERRRRHLRQPSSEVATSLNNLANVVSRLGRPREALPLYRESLEIDRTLRGEHPNVATTMSNLGTALAELGEYGEAARLLTGSLDMFRRIHGNEHPNVSGAMNNLAMLYAECDQPGQAEPLLRQSLDLERRFRSERHWIVGTRMANLGRTLARTGRLDEADALLVDAVALLEADLGAGHIRTIEAGLALADLRLAQQRLDEAESRLLLTHAAAQSVLPDSHWLLGRLLTSLGICRTLLDQFDEAQADLQRARELLAAALGPDHPRTLAAAAALDDLARRRGLNGHAAFEPAQLPGDRRP